MKRLIFSFIAALALACGAHAQFLMGAGAAGQSGQGANLFSNAPTPVTTSTYTVQPSDTSIIVNATASCTLTLPSLGGNVVAGRHLYVLTKAAYTVVSGSSNVVPVASTSAGTAILAATAGKWAILVLDQSGNWQTLASN